MKKRPVNSILFWQTFVLLLFLLLTAANEVLDLPHLLMGDPAIPWAQRGDEIVIEGVIFIVIVGLQTVLLRRLFGRIRTLEGLLPICAGCKRIRSGNRWEPIEAYISRQTPVAFTHSICPECREKLYPEIFSSTDDPKRQKPHQR